MSYQYDYPRPAVTVDCVVFRIFNNRRQVMLIRRSNAPFQNYWAFPGGFVDIEETLEQAAARELYEESGINEINLTQFHTYGDPLRDPRHQTITIVYTGDIGQERTLRAGDDASEAGWFFVDQLPQLAFDHSKILKDILSTK
ncbi:MAG: NUDIX hydrolase [Bacteroidetes bacterium HGW-Bacteroidetes-1]|nr:MAG: NUDIX hydrolase [Bacteroidetes bacterium HGW-Bacteroidetes-1]